MRKVLNAHSRLRVGMNAFDKELVPSIKGCLVVGGNGCRELGNSELWTVSRGTITVVRSSRRVPYGTPKRTQVPLGLRQCNIQVTRDHE